MMMTMVNLKTAHVVSYTYSKKLSGKKILILITLLIPYVVWSASAPPNYRVVSSLGHIIK